MKGFKDVFREDKGSIGGKVLDKSQTVKLLEWSLSPVKGKGPVGGRYYVIQQTVKLLGRASLSSSTRIRTARWSVRRLLSFVRIS